MADPFLSQSVAGIYQELQRLRSENKELRLEVTTLRLRVQDQSLTAQAASSSSSNAPRKTSTKTTNASTGSARVKDVEEDEQNVNTVGVSASQEMRDGQRSDAQTASSAREERLTSPNGTRPATTIRRHSQQGTSSSPVNEELRHGRVVAEKEAAKYKAELKQVTAHFEAFITEVTEREAGYKAVYGGIYHELNEARAKCAGLQRQVQELESRLATLEQQTMKAASGMRVATEPRPTTQVSNTPLQPPKQQQQQQQQQRRRQRETAAEDTAPTRSSSKEGESQVQKQQAANNPSVSASETATTATLDTTAKEIPAPASPFAMPPPVTVTGDKPQTALHIAKGAAALRAANYDKSTQPRRTHTQRGMEGRRGREGHELVRPTAQPRYETPRSSLFARFQQNKADSALNTDADITSTSKSVNDSSTNLHSGSLAGPLASSSTTAKTAIHFGSDPIADFLRLHESTTVAHHRSRLAAELMRHFQQRYEALAEAVVRHFIRSVHRTSSTATSSLSELWAKLEVMMGIAPESILPALTHAALSQLVQLLQGSLTAATANGGEGEEMNVVDEEGQVGVTQSGLPSTSNITNSSATIPPSSAEHHTRQSERDVWWSKRVAKVRLVALMLRLAYLQSASHSSQCHDQGYRCTSDTLLELFVTFTLGALRGWSDMVRRGTNTPSQASTSAMATLVQLWMTGVLALCGYQSSVQLFLRYYNVPEAAITSWVLPHALVCYTVQGIMRLCYMQCAAELQQRRRTTHWHVIRDAQGSSTLVVNECEEAEEGVMTNNSPEKDEEERREGRSGSVWDCFCDALGWSTRQMPLDRLGEAAATLAVQPTSNNEGLRRTCLQSLRCLVLYKGFSYVHTIREYLAHCAGPHGVADAIFAELLSYAVLDLRLADSRDAQWTQTIAFLDDYLNAASNTIISSPTSRSAQDSVSSSSSSNQSLQGLVLRAILQLCASPLNETSVRVLSRAMRWVKSHTIHSNGNTTREDTVPEIGRRLLQLIEQAS